MMTWMKNDNAAARKSRAVGYFALAGATAVLGMLVLPLLIGTAHAHSLMVLESDEENVNPIFVVLGHTNEPTYGALAGIHDGKHDVEVFLEDEATALPISGAELYLDKYYFKNIRSFDKAGSLDDADDIEKGVPMSGVFGEPGHYVSRQVTKEGIYGYRLYGTIDYFGVGEVEVDTVRFCSIDGEDTGKFDGDGWFGGYGCHENIRDTAFPAKNKDVGKAASEVAGDEAQVEQASVSTAAEGQAAATTATTTPVVSSAAAPPQQSAFGGVSALQMLAFGISAAAVAGFAGFRALKQSRRDRLEL